MLGSRKINIVGRDVLRTYCRNSGSLFVTANSLNMDRDRGVASVENSSWTGGQQKDRREDRTEMLGNQDVLKIFDYVSVINGESIFAVVNALEFGDNDEKERDLKKF